MPTTVSASGQCGIFLPLKKFLVNPATPESRRTSARQGGIQSYESNVLEGTRLWTLVDGRVDRRIACGEWGCDRSRGPRRETEVIVGQAPSATASRPHARAGGGGRRRWP